MVDFVLFDTETNGFEYDTLHCTAVAPVSGHKVGDVHLTVGSKELEEWAELHTDDHTIWVAHNACSFDYWVLKDLTNLNVPPERILDTHVLSRLVDYRKYHTHSLSEIGKALGVLKDEYTGGFETYTPEMGAYCKQDVEVLVALWKKLRTYVTRYPDAVQVEHQIAYLCRDMQSNGFKFNKTRAEGLLSEVTEEMSQLEDSMQEEWPPELVVDRAIQWRLTKEGEPYATCLKAMASAPKWERKGDELVLYRYKEFNPGSPKDRVDKLWEAGWKPYDKTKGHVQHERDLRASWRSR